MKLNLSRLALFLLMGVMLLTIGVARPAPAAANQPLKTFVAQGDIEVPGVCPFTVFMHFPVGKEYEKTYFDKAGTMVMDIITGVLKAQLTNETTGKSLEVNISGGEHIYFNPDGSFNNDLSGPSLFWFFPDPSLPAMFTNSGRVEFQVDAQGNLTGYSITGHLIDICKALGN